MMLATEHEQLPAEVSITGTSCLAKCITLWAAAAARVPQAVAAAESIAAAINPDARRVDKVIMAVVSIAAAVVAADFLTIHQAVCKRIQTAALVLTAACQLKAHAMWGKVLTKFHTELALGLLRDQNV